MSAAHSTEDRVWREAIDRTPTAPDTLRINPPAQFTGCGVVANAVVPVPSCPNRL